MNISDPQLSDEDWSANHPYPKILIDTLTTLIHRVQPDLITVSGDLAWGGNAFSCTNFAEQINLFQIPWAPIWGNHDNEMGSAYMDSIADTYLTYKHCIYEKGPKELGNGNYVIAIEEDGRIVEGIIMMDSHNRDYFKNENGDVYLVYSKLYPEQLVWYREQVEMLQKRGCNDTTMILHIPIYAYRTAFEKAFNTTFTHNKISLEDSYKGDCWNEGYKDSFGVRFEGISSYPVDDGVFDLVKKLNSTKTIVAGHDHCNNFVIKHEGVTLAFATKTGIGSYWDSSLNGGTVLLIGSNGVKEVRHEYTKIKFDYKLM